MHIASACNFFCNFYHSITFQLLVYRYFLHSFISKLSILMYVLWEWTSEPICKTWAMQFSNSHARTFIRLNSVVYIFFSFTRNFVLSVEFPPKRPEKESWNSLEFFHDGIRRRHYGFQMISLSKSSSSYFLQSSMKEIQPRQVFILKVLVIAPNFKASSIFQFLHR